MKEHKIICVHAPDIKIIAVTEPSIYVKPGTAYIVNDLSNPLEYARHLYQAEKDVNNWIRKYEKLYKGLQYWKAKAESK